MSDKTQILLDIDADGKLCGEDCVSFKEYDNEDRKYIKMCRYFGLVIFDSKRTKGCLAAEAAAKKMDDTICEQDNIMRAQDLVNEGLRGKILKLMENDPLLDDPEIREGIELARKYRMRKHTPGMLGQYEAIKICRAVLRLAGEEE